MMLLFSSRHWKKVKKGAMAVLYAFGFLRSTSTKYEIGAKLKTFSLVASAYCWRFLKSSDFSLRCAWNSKWLTICLWFCDVTFSKRIPFEKGYHLKLNIELKGGVSIHQSRRCIASFMSFELLPGITTYLKRSLLYMFEKGIFESDF